MEHGYTRLQEMDTYNCERFTINLTMYQEEFYMGNKYGRSKRRREERNMEVVDRLKNSFGV